MNSHHSHFLPFDIEFDQWTPNEDIDICEYVPVLVPYADEEIIKQCRFLKSLGFRNQKIIALDLFHADDQVNDVQRYKNLKTIYQNYLTDKVVVVHTNKENKEDIFYDFLWNRQKAYFTDYNKFNLDDRVWTWGSNIKMFGLTKIFKFNNDCRTFICPNRIQYVNGVMAEHHRFTCRKKLLEHLKDKDGWVSEPINNKVLEPEQQEIINSLMGGRSGTWYPVSNHLYNSSFVSIYIETITMTTGMSFKYKTVTEKTWDPLIKGHFILPFGYMGLIEDIKSYGFWLPDWIDYSYDNINDDTARFEAFMKSVDKVLEIDKEILRKKFNESIDKLYYNRLIFWNRPYDCLHKKINDYFIRHDN